MSKIERIKQLEGEVSELRRDLDLLLDFVGVCVTFEKKIKEPTMDERVEAQVYGYKAEDKIVREYKIEFKKDTITKLSEGVSQMIKDFEAYEYCPKKVKTGIPTKKK